MVLPVLPAVAGSLMTLPTGAGAALAGRAIADLIRESSRQDHQLALARLESDTQCRLRQIDAQLQLALADIALQDRESQRAFELALSRLQMQAHERQAVIAALCRVLEAPTTSEAARLQVMQSLIAFLASNPLI